MDIGDIKGVYGVMGPLRAGTSQKHTKNKHTNKEIVPQIANRGIILNLSLVL